MNILMTILFYGSMVEDIELNLFSKNILIFNPLIISDIYKPTSRPYNSVKILAYKNHADKMYLLHKFLNKHFFCTKLCILHNHTVL